MLTGRNLFGEYDKEAQAIARIKEHVPSDGYYVAFSGGNDSVVILDLVRRAGVPFEIHHSLTTIDPPELVQFVRSVPGVIIERPRKTYLEFMIMRRIPPSRNRSWCCIELK